MKEALQAKDFCLMCATRGNRRLEPSIAEGLERSTLVLEWFWTKAEEFSKRSHPYIASGLEEGWLKESSGSAGLLCLI